MFYRGEFSSKGCVGFIEVSSQNGSIITKWALTNHLWPISGRRDIWSGVKKTQKINYIRSFSRCLKIFSFGDVYKAVCQVIYV